jgi:KamA family protein
VLNSSINNKSKTVNNIDDTRKYKSYNLRNLKTIPQISNLADETRFAMEVVGNVLPFKANNYVVEELINWDNIPDDPIFKLTFPQKDMLKPGHFNEMADLIASGTDKNSIRAKADEIRWQLNPHPAGQVELNKPELACGTRLDGMQHKYRETVLFFPSQGQTCHAYCTFCFRWPQFVGIDELKFAMRESELLVEYLRAHPEVTDVLFTGGDPLIMKASVLAGYIQPLIDADLPNLRTIRIGTKSLSYWPYKFTTDRDADDLIRLFERVTRAGKHLALMGHFSHGIELQTQAVQQAIRRIRDTGTEIRSQSPLLRGINDSSEIWSDMWNEQVRQGIIPYYMFVVRDTGAQHYFDIPLEKTWQIFRDAYQNISGIGRTVRGPSMSANPGKVQVLGISEVLGEKVFVLRMIQGRNPDWVHRPFFAKYKPDAVWLTDLEPAFGEEKFFFEDELASMEATAGNDHITTHIDELIDA